MARTVAVLLLAILFPALPIIAAEPAPSGPADEHEDDYYRVVTLSRQASPTESRSKEWRPDPRGPVLEVGGLEALEDGRLVVTTRKGEVWLLDNVEQDSPDQVGYQLWASGLHEPLGVIRHVDRRGRDAFVVAQRSELTALRGGDAAATSFGTYAKGWGVTGNYHEYAYGPRVGPDGQLWVALNVGMGDRLNDDDRWRGWVVKTDDRGGVVPVCAGMRSPCGIGADASGELFITDQQGDWIATCSLHHLRDGAFFGHPASLKTADSSVPLARELVDAVTAIGEYPSGLTWPEALRKIPRLRPPAVWFPYKQAGQSATDIVCDTTGGRFGPFAGQLFVGEFRLAGVLRVFLEQVDGEYQGACFPFRQGLASGVVRLEFGRDGGLFAGLTNRGWSSLGTASYGLQRLAWTGRAPFEILAMRALPDGFELELTAPCERASAADPGLYQLSSHTYLLHKVYGSPEVERQALAARQVEVSKDGLRIRLAIDGLRAGYVHELHAPGLRAADGRRLLHDSAFYTLNAIPRGQR